MKRKKVFHCHSNREKLFFAMTSHHKHPHIHSFATRTPKQLLIGYSEQLSFLSRRTIIARGLINHALSERWRLEWARKKEKNYSRTRRRVFANLMLCARDKKVKLKTLFIDMSQSDLGRSFFPQLLITKERSQRFRLHVDCRFREITF